MWTALRSRLCHALRGVEPEGGPYWPGAGTGIGTDVLLDVLANDIVAVEPSARLRGRPARPSPRPWRPRAGHGVPEPAPLTGILGGAAAEPDPGRRAAELADLVFLCLPDATVTVPQLVRREPGFSGAGPTGREATLGQGQRGAITAPAGRTAATADVAQWRLDLSARPGDRLGPTGATGRGNLVDVAHRQRPVVPLRHSRSEACRQCRHP